MKLLYGISLFCGLTPLTAGISIYVLWLLTGRDEFVVAGVYTIYVGVALVAVGSICLVVYLFKVKRLDQWRKPAIKRAAIGASVLLVNLPVCLVIVLLAFSDVTEFTVVVENESAATISRFALEGPGVNEHWTDVGPGESREAAMHFSHDGTLTYRARINSLPHQGVVAGYVTNGMGGRVLVTLSPDTVFFIRAP